MAEYKKLIEPIDINAEKRLLGYCMYDIDCVNNMLSQLNEEDFHDINNKLIFRCIGGLYSKDREVTLTSIVEAMSVICEKSRPTVTYLGSLYECAPQSYLSQDLIDEVKEASFKNKIYNFGMIYTSEVGTTRMKAYDFYETMVGKLCQLDNNQNQKGGKSFVKIVEEGFKGKSFLEDLQERQEKFLNGKPAFDGYLTHWKDLDKLIFGLTPGHFTIVGARPSVGKTTFALQLIERLVFRSFINCIFFSLEMPSEEIVKKILGAFAQVAYDKINSGSVKGPEYQKLLEATKAWNPEQLTIEDQPALTIDQVYNRARRAVKAYKAKVVVIDYIQLLRSSKSTESRQIEVAEISRSCKAMAKDLNISVVALAQLNRDLEKRTEKRPFLSDLRESGSLEADADEIILLHRPELYEKFEKPGFMEIIIAKNRFGSIGSFYLAFKKDIGRLEDCYNEDPKDAEKFKSFNAYKED
jgi:replicative DNA helicase